MENRIIKVIILQPDFEPLTNNLEYNQTIENNQKIESISNTNNIKLNNFGEEDISHITDEFKMKITLPYGMVQQMVESPF